MPNIICQQCKTEFKVIPAREKTAKFCSVKCRADWRSINWNGKNHPRWQGGEREKKCQECGKFFSHQPPATYATFKKQRFCSHECGWKGQHYNSGAEHYAWREDRQTRRLARNGKHRSWANAVISRDKAACQICGATKAELHAHHIKSWRDYPELRWDIDNGQTLCAQCHWHVHAVLSANEVNSGEAASGNAGGNPEPSHGRKPVEGVTTRGRSYRRYEGNCDYCGAFVSKRWSDVKNNKHVCCSRSCASKLNRQRK